MRSARAVTLALTLLAVAALVGCPHVLPAPPPGPDADGGTPDGPEAGPLPGDAPYTTPEAGVACSAACSNLAQLACVEGADPACAVTCQKAQDARLTDLHPACLAAAKSKAEARACGSVKCP